MCDCVPVCMTACLYVCVTACLYVCVTACLDVRRRPATGSWSVPGSVIRVDRLFFCKPKFLKQNYRPKFGKICHFS